MPYFEVATYFSALGAGEFAIINALEKRGYNRYLTRSKTPLSERKMMTRKSWADPIVIDLQRTGHLFCGVTRLG